MQKFLIESKETLQFAIDETAATHRMLTQMKGILAIIKHRMNKKNSKHVDCTLANLRLKCEKQISIMVHLLSLHLDNMREDVERTHTTIVKRPTQRASNGRFWLVFKHNARKCFKLTLFLLQQTLDSDWSVELQVYYINVDIYAE
jgi:hypothetical protein